MLKRTTMFALVACLTMAACGGDGSPEATSPSPSATPSPPTEGEVKAAFLTEAEVGEKFKGGPPTEESKNASGKDAKPLCGIKTPEAELQLSALFTHESGTQVYEQIRVHEAGGAEEVIATRRAQSEAACEFNESVGETKYRVKVGGPIPDFPTFGEQSFGHITTYTGGYVGQRYSMVAKVGLAVVYMEYTSSDFDAAFGIATFRKAVEKAGSLAS